MDQYRVDIILADGKRRRGFYSPETPDMIQSARFSFHAGDTMLQGARIVTGDAQMRELLLANGFNATQPNAESSVFCVRLPSEAVKAVNEIAEQTGRKPTSVIGEAVKYWLRMGAPIEPKKRTAGWKVTRVENPSED